jgi:hypothetical protein
MAGYMVNFLFNPIKNSTKVMQETSFPFIYPFNSNGWTDMRKLIVVFPICCAISPKKVS